MKKILITGSDGFIGSHLTEKLVKCGYEVTAYVYYNSFNYWGWLEDIDKRVLNNIKIISGDIRDFQSVYNASKKIDCIINLAALIGIPYSYSSPESYIHTNIIGTSNVLNAGIRNNVSKIIHTSTSEVYGTPKNLPIKEIASLNAQSPYAATKIAADQLALSYNKSFETPVTILRPFNTFGPRQSARAIIPNIISQLLTGSKVKIGNLKPTREYNYIEDTVNAFRLAIDNKKIIGDVLNIGNGFNISVKELGTQISNILNKEIKFDIDKSRIRKPKTEVKDLKADNSKAKKILKWTPKFSGKVGLNKGLKETIIWFSEPKNLLKYKKNIYNI
jgi:NAD dependent epimerase/dehydratase